MIPTAAIAQSRPLPRKPVGIGGQQTPTGRLRAGPGIVRFDDALALLAALREGRIHAAVRGSLPAGTFLQALGADAGNVQRGVLLEPRRGRGVVLGPVGVTEGTSVGARVRFAKQAVELLARAQLLTEDPLIAVLAGGRAEDVSRGAPVGRSLARAEEVVQRLERKGLDAFPAGALLEDVISEVDVVVTPDGATGNLLFRALHLVAGVPSYGALCTGTRLALVDTSRARKSYELPLRFAAFLAKGAARGD